ncbi:MAG: thiamine phosphate synthase [Deltaproteobacteria bacterium]|jgi:thiamine-phosphate pyrophosphorylase|nr:thiamine phosphate synthase [Deltaproteobacteria bacterium]
MFKKKALNARLRLTLVIGKSDVSGRSVRETAEAAFSGGATALQLREKTLPDREFYEEALELAALCRERSKLFIVNNRLDIALAVRADGVHLGDGDLPVEAAAALAPKKMILGYSAPDQEAAKKAVLAGADYLGVGAVFPSPSKPECPVMPAETVASIVGLRQPTVGIGGITVQNSNLAWSHGFNGLALISALCGAPDPAEAARKILSGCV